MSSIITARLGLAVEVRVITWAFYGFLGVESGLRVGLEWVYSEVTYGFIIVYIRFRMVYMGSRVTLIDRIQM